jgi:hypothetical protein
MILLITIQKTKLRRGSIRNLFLAMRIGVVLRRGTTSKKPSIERTLRLRMRYHICHSKYISWTWWAIVLRLSREHSNNSHQKIRTLGLSSWGRMKIYRKWFIRVNWMKLRMRLIINCNYSPFRRNSRSWHRRWTVNLGRNLNIWKF